MHRFVNTIAMAASVVTLGAGLWQNWGMLATMKKMIMAYMGFFFLGSMMTLLIVSIPMFESPKEKNEARKNKKVKINEKKVA
ncbi:MAG: hypothetical protein GY780_10930 [bacterium]|nr:hypothetical protein [bacterium]